MKETINQIDFAEEKSWKQNKHKRFSNKKTNLVVFSVVILKELFLLLTI